MRWTRGVQRRKSPGRRAGRASARRLRRAARGDTRAAACSPSGGAGGRARRGDIIPYSVGLVTRRTHRAREASYE